VVIYLKLDRDKMMEKKSEILGTSMFEQWLEIFQTSIVNQNHSVLWYRFKEPPAISDTAENGNYK
jgi:hypothetical protein